MENVKTPEAGGKEETAAVGRRYLAESRANLERTIALVGENADDPAVLARMARIREMHTEVEAICDELLRRAGT